MRDDENDGQMIFGDLGGLKLPDICLTGEEKPWKNLTQKICPDRGSNPGPLRNRRACCHMAHSSGQMPKEMSDHKNDCKREASDDDYDDNSVVGM